ncbi:MAG: hypothetical protein KA073_02855 [Aliarcobacter sp.]|nr:hypothetical protein [Aliarcobacter sp.]
MKKELTVFILILITLTITVHYKEFLEYPIEHIKNFPNSSAYGLGVFHPIVFTAIIYILLLVPRLIFRFLRRKKNEKNIK